ncbi:hypothetical protein [Brevibacillus choshinensis]|uniref:GGDEF domain-containing protein n=1 Tax=Brevibacillus choshinensis TaxID=54911 RepID=A0ABX7FIA2_BRECH|nr:hypothetical protein [Brevibacillus choshinensis]QRG65953.1 hypothetical protein JNE38_20560 [Brevibacillus choshinensis]
MQSPYFAIAIGVICFILSILRGIGIIIPSQVIALFSISAVAFTVQDFVNQITSKEKYQKMAIITSIFLFGLLLLGLIFPNYFTTYKDQLSIIGDIATIFSLGLVLLTVGLRDISQYKKIKDNKKVENKLNNFSLDIVKEMVTQEYHSMLKINDIIERLKMIDHEVFGRGRVHNGWSIFFDTLEMFRYGGPLYDGKNEELFKQFIILLDGATNIFVNLSDPNPRTMRDEGAINIWDEDYEISSYSIGVGTTVQEDLKNGINYLKEALEKWEMVKGNTIKQFEKVGKR